MSSLPDVPMNNGCYAYNPALRDSMVLVEFEEKLSKLTWNMFWHRKERTINWFSCSPSSFDSRLFFPFHFIIDPSLPQSLSLSNFYLLFHESTNLIGLTRCKYLMMLKIHSKTLPIYVNAKREWWKYWICIKSKRISTQVASF